MKLNFFLKEIKKVKFFPLIKGADLEKATDGNKTK